MKNLGKAMADLTVALKSDSETTSEVAALGLIAATAAVALGLVGVTVAIGLYVGGWAVLAWGVLLFTYIARSAVRTVRVLEAEREKRQ